MHCGASQKLKIWVHDLKQHRFNPWWIIKIYVVIPSQQHRSGGEITVIIYPAEWKEMMGHCPRSKIFIALSCALLAPQGHDEILLISLWPSNVSAPFVDNVDKKDRAGSICSWSAAHTREKWHAYSSPREYTGCLLFYRHKSEIWLINLADVYDCD